MKRKALTVIILFTLAFIWGHSMVPRSASADESGYFLKILYPVLSVILGTGGVTNHLIRKIAHFTEYFILGTELRLYQNVRTSGAEVPFGTTPPAKRGSFMKGIHRLLHGRMLTSVRFAFYIAFIDETIQIFSGRGPQIADVWLDVLGAFCGAGIVSLLSA